MSYCKNLRSSEKPDFPYTIHENYTTSPPIGLAIIIGAGPNTGTGITRILSSPGNLAVALLARRQESLKDTRDSLKQSLPSSVIETFSSDTSIASREKAFQGIKIHASFKDLKLKVAVYSIKHSSKKPFMTETYEHVGGAMAFQQETIKRFYDDYGEAPLFETNGEKKGTLIFTGTLGALRANAEFGTYGAGKSEVRQFAQILARELSVEGIHVVHTIANGTIADENGEAQKMGKKISADAARKKSTCA